MIRRYRNGDALRVAVQQAQQDEAVDGCGGFDHVGLCSLVDDDDNVLAVFGVCLAAPSVMDCYALMAQQAGRKLLEAVRFLRREIPSFMRMRGVKLLRMTVKKDFLAGQRFALMIGFGAAEVLPKFYKENDYQLFERIEKW